MIDVGELWREISALRRQIDALQNHEFTTQDQFLGARVHRTSGFTATASSDGDVDFQAESFDVGGLWDSGNPERVNLTVPGLWLCSAYLYVGGTGSQPFAISIVEGPDVSITNYGYYRKVTNGSHSETWHASAQIYVSAADAPTYVRVRWQNSDPSVNRPVAGSFSQCWLSAIRVPRIAA